MRARHRRLAIVTVVAFTMVVAGGVASGSAAKPHRSNDADTVLVNGFVYTVDRKNSVAQAVAIDRGEIVYVGRNQGARRFVGDDTEVIDLAGRMVMPGIHDGHIHGVTNPAQPTCDLEAAPLTIPEFQARVQACLDDPRFHTGEIGAPDDFLVVENLYFQFMRPAGTVPHKSMLDALGTDRPILVTAAVTAHNILVNQNALDLAGITRDTPDPPGGRIEHDPDGEPSGILQDTAQDLVLSLVPPPPPISEERRIELAAERMGDFSQEGVTSFLQPLASEQLIRTFAGLQDTGGLTARAHFASEATFDDLRDPTPMYARMAQLRASYEDPSELPRSVISWRPGRQRGAELVPEPGVSVDAVKVFLDGIVQFPAQTAYMSSPYLDENGNPRTDENAQGELFADASVLAPVITELQRRGFQSHVHAIGDGAVTIALDSIGRAARANPWDRSHPTIAHAEMVNPVDYKRFGKYGVTASMGLQWAKPAPDSTDAVKPYVGDRWDWYEPTVPITKGGGRVSLGSDCCLDPFDEWFALEVAALREADWGPEFPEFLGTLNALPGMPLRDAIRAVTINGAYQLHQEKVTGSLEEGKLADLVVLNQNITRIPLDDISNTDVLMTMVGGEKVWVDPAF